MLSATNVVTYIACVEIESEFAIVLDKVASIYILLHPVFVLAFGDGGG